MANQNLELFYKPTCPYCHKVLSFMEANNIELPLHDIMADDAARERLIEVGGKRQVPCLFIDGKAMYESDDIINFLTKTYSVSAASAEQSTNTQHSDTSAGGSCTIGGSCSF